MRRVQQIMGMPISLDVAGEVSERTFESFFGLFKKYDRQFSPFLPGSETSRLARGELAPGQISREMRQILLMGDKFNRLSGGFFSFYYAKHFDPSGLVKGWVIERAAKILRQQGTATFLINAGGDILARGSKGHDWQIALQHPLNRQSIFGTIRADNIAVATSGNYERGRHIINPHTKTSPTELLSFTVMGPEIIWADVLATTGFAIGKGGVDFINNFDGYQAIAIDKNLKIQTTNGLKGELLANNSLLRNSKLA